MRCTAQTFKTLFTFDATDGFGAQPLVQATDGDFYGTTEFGGANDTCMEEGRATLCGTVFRITSRGRLTTLHSFDGTDGFLPIGALVQATDGRFYGTTFAGGSYSSCMLAYEINGCGTVFRMTAGGTLSMLHSFGSGDGGLPNGGLVQATDEYFYGTTQYSAFKVTAKGALTTLDFIDGGEDGEFPNGELVQASNGNLYGTTGFGGSTTINCADPGGTPPGGCGTVFKLTEMGALTVLHSFDGTDGQAPNGLMQATDGNFYGTTSQGGANNDGTVFIFKLNSGGTGGKLTTLHNFDGSDGAFPSGLFQATNGIVYGTTVDTVFSLNVGLGPFVKTVPISGKVGANVTILGTDLAGATSVTFSGTPATAFTVNSTNSAITTKVPTGATTGTVQVVTPSGTLSSNAQFRILP